MKRKHSGKTATHSEVIITGRVVAHLGGQAVINALQSGTPLGGQAVAVSAYQFSSNALPAIGEVVTLALKATPVPAKIVQTVVRAHVGDATSKAA